MITANPSSGASMAFKDTKSKHDKATARKNHKNDATLIMSDFSFSTRCFVEY